MVIQTLTLVLARRVGTLLLGVVILWQVVEHCGSHTGRAIVRV